MTSLHVTTNPIKGSKVSFFCSCQLQPVKSFNLEKINLDTFAAQIIHKFTFIQVQPRTRDKHSVNLISLVSAALLASQNELVVAAEAGRSSFEG